MDKWALHRWLNSIRCTNSESEALDNLALLVVEYANSAQLQELAHERLAARQLKPKDFVEVK